MGFVDEEEVGLSGSGEVKVGLRCMVVEEGEYSGVHEWRTVNNSGVQILYCQP